MPTDPAVFSAVAKTLGGADPAVEAEVEDFYKRLGGRGYTPRQRGLVFDFLVASETVPDDSALQRLADLVGQVGKRQKDSAKRRPAQRVPMKGEPVADGAITN